MGHVRKDIPEEIKEYLEYSPSSRKMYWKKSTSRRVKEGEEAGAPSDYIKIKFKRKTYSGHRVAWFLHYGEQPPEFIDHVDRNPFNNKIENLRKSCNQTNQYNSRSQVGSKSKYKGVDFNKAQNKWRARIKNKQGKREFLGWFETEEKAADVYNKRALDIQGEFSVQNY